MRGRAQAWLVLCLLAAGCAVRGYDLGWQRDDGLSERLGAPRDALSGCRFSGAAPSPSQACRLLVSDVRARLAALGPVANAPTALGAECRGDVCAYANVFERRDVGAALIVPVYRKVVLRTVRIRMVRGEAGRWEIGQLSVLDQAPPDYGPVRIGG